MQPKLILQLRLQKGKSQSYLRAEEELELTTASLLYCCIHCIVLTLNYIFLVMKDCGKRGIATKSGKKYTECFQISFLKPVYFRVICLTLNDHLIMNIKPWYGVEEIFYFSHPPPHLYPYDP